MTIKILFDNGNTTTWEVTNEKVNYNPEDGIITLHTKEKGIVLINKEKICYIEAK